MIIAAHGEAGARLRDFLDRRRDDIIGSWVETGFFGEAAGDAAADVRADCENVLTALSHVVETGNLHDPAAEPFQEIRALLGGLAAQQARQGNTAAQITANLTWLKEPVLRLWLDEQPEGQQRTEDVLALSAALDTLRLVVMETAVTEGADIIAHQQQQLAEMSTPIIKLWKGVLAVPLIGTLDSMRSQAATESLLQAIVDQQAQVAILDITGVPAVDTMVAQHLLKTAMAARLMGAECIISGIRPQIAQTMVQLGIDLGEVATRASLSDALAYALNRVGLSVTPAQRG
ncbi:STAS domain-containing protein [Goodfellowiella coeruleoviolacea]|uniref:RsbT co-antagonist protein RsbR n=1 Tax=Goodfellowiella coeruleoviolacea TaxID=334858 RepID=A0AAE3GFP5_9PSEU|nr:STAS domain-containing protein [Goodfellowiella coeruleoviolacea]MCP2166509.1 rsbT co-antagonist protein RsbR [Goodfellowiella coeruleoviolacea]